MNIEIVNVNRQRRLVIHEDYLKITQFARIEMMIEELQSSDELAFDVLVGPQNKLQLQKKDLAKYYYDAKAVLEAHSSGYSYSPRMQAFFDAFSILGIDVETFEFGRPLDVFIPSGWYYADIFNELILVIREHCGTSKYQTQLRKHKENGRRRVGKFFMWEKKIFERRSRHLVLLLHLGYQPRQRGSVTPMDIQRHLQRMLQNKRSNALLRGIKDYVWRIEEGRRTGLHAHLLISYDTKFKNGISVTRRLGEYWKNATTKGMGKYWNGNLDGWKRRGENGRNGLGTGQINHNDLEQRAELRKILVYLAKGDQYLRRKWGAKFKTFALSRPGEKQVQGRPRRGCEADSCM